MISRVYLPRNFFQSSVEREEKDGSEESFEFSLEHDGKERGEKKTDREHLSDSSSIGSLAFVDLNRGFCTYQKLGVFGESESPWSPRGTFQQAGRLLVRFREIVLVVLEPLRQTRRQGNEGEEHHRGQPRPSHPVAARQFSRPPERFVRSVDELERTDWL